MDGRLSLSEIASFVAAPACGALLADLGAEVVKVEPPGGDPVRHLPPLHRRLPDRCDRRPRRDRAATRERSIDDRAEGG